MAPRCSCSRPVATPSSTSNSARWTIAWPKAQNQIGMMYRKGEGVQPSPARAFMWFSLAAKRGDAKAKAGLRDVSKSMTPGEISQARQMAQACEASNYRSCEY